ncbi:MAG: SAM hydrolase/SAM-dependent halogenase family protein [Thermodesulfobacteriota bacterium]
MKSTPNPVFLLTDFGLSDVYAGQLRAAIVAVKSDIPVIDLTHGVQPFNIRQAGFFLAASINHVPEQSSIVCVVDPGVGGNRDILLLDFKNRWVIAPDNGLVSLLLRQEVARECLYLFPAKDCSRTFHGRDIFAPAAAKLSLGKDPRELGVPVSVRDIKRDRGIDPELSSGKLKCLALHIDRFGNIVLNLKPASKCTASLGRVSWSIANIPLRPVSAYAQLTEHEIGILPGSQGYLELAMNKQHAGHRLALDAGREIEIILGADE